MGAWFSSRSQPLSFNKNEYELHHGYKKPLKDNKNNTRRNGNNFLGARLKHNNTRKNTPGFIKLLTSGVVSKRNINYTEPNNTEPVHQNILSVPNILITKNIINHRHKILKGLFSHLGI